MRLLRPARNVAVSVESAPDRPARGARVNLRLLLLHPGAVWSTSDVFDGLTFGLKAHGAECIPYRLDQRLALARKYLNDRWRQQKKDRPDLPRPTQADLLYRAGVDALEMALRQQVHAVIVVSGMFLHPDVLILMRRAGLKVFVLFTETPYDLGSELKVAALVDGCWTNERSCVASFRQVNPNSGYLPHGWHPEKHGPDAPILNVPSHDVVFVGSGFPERIEWFNAIDWSGIDLGLYGTWKGLGLKKQVRAALRGEQVGNDVAAALYRKAKIGINLYRTRNQQRMRVAGESLSPRAYELAACGAFHISDYRAEVAEVFGASVPTFRTPSEAAVLLRSWLANDAARLETAATLPACVAEASWVQRAATVLGDLHRFFAAREAAA